MLRRQRGKASKIRVHLKRPSIVLLLVLAWPSVARAQTVTCSLSAPLGATGRATATGHTEPIAAGANALPPTPGGGTLRITCTNNGSSFTAGVGGLTVSLNASITNATTHPSPSAGIRLGGETGAFIAGGNIAISTVNNSAGTIAITLGTGGGITFPSSSTNTFEIYGVLVSTVGKS